MTLGKWVCVNDLGNHLTVANNISIIVVSRLCICSCGPHKEYSSDNLAVGIFQILFLIFLSSVLKCSSSISVTHSVVLLPNSRYGRRRQLPSLLRERESSLTSVQRFVLQRLRDRPPRYDDGNQIRLEKPPAYQEAVSASTVSLLLFFALYVPNCILLFSMLCVRWLYSEACVAQHLCCNIFSDCEENLQHP